MNPVINPLELIPLLKSYFLDSNRLNRLNNAQIKKYKNKAFRKIIKYAYNVPVYHNKYKKAGIYPSDIKTIEDIRKLPFISKKDLVEAYPDKLLPVNYYKDKAHVVGTGGTSGKPVYLYTDFYTIGQTIGISIRELKHLDLNFRKTKTAHIGNFSPYRIDLVTQEHFQRHLKSFISMRNTLNIDVNQSIKKIINKLEEFQPDIIITYPAIFQHLAFLKRNGYAKNIKPRLCWTGGAMLDDYTKKYVEDAFKCRLLNIYPSVEAGANIAFECFDGTWHIHHDYFYVEAIDDNQQLVDEGNQGHIVLTRLWGRATPIIRYTGMDDWVTIGSEKECSCGLKTPVLKDGVEGRMRANIILPNGKIFPPGAFCFITPVLQKLKTYKVRQYQIIQEKLNEINIKIVIDKHLRNKGASVEKIFKNIKKTYQEKTGPNVEINVFEVEEIKNKKNASKPAPIVISKVSKKQGFNIIKSKN